MSLQIFFLFLTLVPSLQSLPDEHQTLTTQAMIMQACDGVNNQSSCIVNLQNEIETTDFRPGPREPISILRAALKATLKEAQHAIEMITNFNSLSISYREQIAIEDCQELLDFSVSELAWSVAEMRSANRHSQGNLKAWLSAALSNQDTCLQGFEGTNRLLEEFIRVSLKQVTQLISNVLAMYTQMHSFPISPRRTEPDFPNWVSERGEEFMFSDRFGMHVNATVALDGSGHYQSIAEAVFEAPSHSNDRYVIYIKRGVYRENIDMKKKKTNIMFVGDGIGETVVTGDRNFMQGWTTFRTATVAVSGKGFIARDMTFQNTAGPKNYQAVALRVDSDQSAFYRCSFEGYQDTLYAHSLRQFYRECDIYGTIDFIFGNGAAVLQNCRIFTRNPLPLQKVTITAQGRKSPDQSTGFSIQDSFIYATRPTYLGRPWKEYSRVVFLNTYMSVQVQPRGWLEWFGTYALDTLYYGEYRNYGPGSSLSGRVSWSGYHRELDASVAKFFTVGRFIDGLSWLPETGVKFSSGLR